MISQEPLRPEENTEDCAICHGWGFWSWQSDQNTSAYVGICRTCGGRGWLLRLPATMMQEGEAP